MELFQGINYKILNKGKEVEYTGIEYDSRKIKNNNIFFALEGKNFDGHKYIKMAIENGAKMIVVSKELETLHKDISYIEVEDTRKIMGQVASNFYNKPEKKIKIIGVTGTNGKTTSTYILESLLGKVARIGTVEYKVGDEVFEAINTTPESLDIIKIIDLALKKNIKYLVMEVSSHALEMARVDMLDFDVAVFTNLSQDHLDYHENMEKYFLAKRKLFLKLKDKRKSVINIDDNNGKILFNEFKGISYGEKAILSGKVLEYNLSHMKIELTYKGDTYVKNVKLMGLFNLYNIMGAVGGALQLGFEFKNICDKLENLSAVPGRFQMVEAGQNYMVVVDYAHTPDGLKNILLALDSIKKTRIITVFGAGGDRDKTKRPLMALEASKYSDYIILTSDNPRTENPKLILDDVEKGLENSNIFYEKQVNREEALKRAIQIARKDDIILIAGKGHETYQIIANEKIHFDDREIAKKYILENKL